MNIIGSVGQQKVNIYNNRIQNKGIPITHKNSNVSFKGAEAVVKKEAATLIKESDRKILNIFSQHYGDIGEKLGEKVAKLTTKSELLRRSSRFSLEKGALSIKEKKIPQALLENIVFPFINLPLYAASWVLKKAQSVPGLKEKAKKLYYKPFFRIPRKFNELDSKTDIIKGIFDKTQESVKNFADYKGISPEKLINQLNNIDSEPQSQELIKEANEYIKESLYKVSNKFFDKHTGNYNTAYERPLNRIVSGLIPAAFLANDAYNLSVLCGDKKEASKKEAKERRSQEISRVFTTAYIQLLTFGAFTKQVNNIPWFAAVTSAATVLFSEITSRKRLGKPVFFLNKENAKKYNQKNKLKLEQTDNSQQDNSQPVNNKDEKSKLNTKNTNFKGISDNKTEQKNKESTKKSENNTNKEPKKALINADTFKKAVIILITGGFALSFIKNSSYTKNTKLVKGVKNLFSQIKNKIYNPLAFKDFELSSKEFNSIINSLKESGCTEIAQGHEYIKNKYSQETKDGIIKLYKSKLSDTKAKQAVDSVIENLKSSSISLADNDYNKISESIKKAISIEQTAIAENEFSFVSKRAADIIKNKKINLTDKELNSLSETITDSISKNAEKTTIQVDTKLKPFVDIITEPFSFIGSAIRLPFKITSSLLKIAVSPIEKKAEKAALGEIELSKVEKGIHKAVTELFGEKQAKAGKINQTIFSNAMEYFSKRTMPYRKAKEALDYAEKHNLSKEEINNAKNILKKEKVKLEKYVRRSVENSFNGVTQSSNKNTDLAMMSKLASSAVTSAFLVADNYNMVMIKSNGEDKDTAKETANERIIQRLSALFYQTLLINWFNATFRSTYNSSLKGMTAVVIPNTITTEVLTRKSIGMPIGKKSFEELQEIDEKNENRKGFLGKYFKFMRLLTGKKPLKDRLPKDNSNINKNVKKLVPVNMNTTNLIERYSK